MTQAQPVYTNAQYQAFDCLIDHRCRLVLQILRDNNAIVPEISAEVIRRVNGVFRMPIATLYSNLLRLEALGLITVHHVDRKRPGRPRRILSITSFGRSCLEIYLTATADPPPSP